MTDQEDESARALDGSDGELLDPEGLEVLLDFLKRARGFDFGGYKRSSLSRRILKRMQGLGVTRYLDYVDYLEVHPDEFPQLFNMILINVTGFYRDPASWTELSNGVAHLIARKRADEPIRIWSAGCASGEEAYTLAMVIAEIVGVDACIKRLKIYATDLDEDALGHARQATYSAKAVEGVPPALLDKYFTASGSGFVFHREIRRAVIFGRHDLLQDAPISRVDVLACRNTLMYFNVEAQTQILNRLHFALASDGLLFLGKAEMLLTHTDLFVPLDLKLRLFQRARGETRLREAMPRPGPPSPGPDGERRTGEQRRLESAVDLAPIALIGLDADGRITLVNARAASLFSLGTRDVGRPFHELELSYRPVDLRSCIDRAWSESRTVTLKDVERVIANGAKTVFDIEVAPLPGDDGESPGIQLSFADVTAAHKLQSELKSASVELEAAHEELQSTSEELETTNEELQSTVEELETTNEELQSTNEELETMNEELQSTNEELQTINEELRQRGDELNDVNSFLGAILGSLSAGVAVLDGALLVSAWNVRMEEMWGLRTEEVRGKNFLALDIGVPLEDLRAAIVSALDGNGDRITILDCINRRGKPLRCKITMNPLRGEGVRSAAVIILFEEVAPAA